MQNVCVPFKEDGTRVTSVAEAAVTGMRGVVISGDTAPDGLYTVSPAGAGDAIFGIAEWDAPVGGQVGVIRKSGIIVPVTAGGSIAAGDAVQVDAQGRVITQAAGAKVGTCLSGVAASGDVATISLFV